MTTRTSATSGNWRADDADTWGLGLNNYPAAGEHVVIDTGHTVTLGESNDAGSIKLIGTLAGGGHTLTLNDGGDSEIFDHDGTITGTLNITITGTTNRLLDLAGSSGSVNNLTINASSTTFTLSGTGTHTVAGDLTLTAGTLDTGSTGIPMTVTGDVSVASGGTLDIDAASSDANYSFGSLTINSGGEVQAPSHGTITLTSETSGGYTWRNNGGTFTHNNGTVTTNSSVDTKIRENTFYNLRINQSSSGKFVYWEDTSGNTCTVANDLTITTGRLRGLVASDTVTVTGDVLVNANGTFNHTSVWTGSINHGSLTINSGGTYNATSGTTTILGSSGGFALLDEGTFTHNGGTVKIDFETSNLNSSTRIHQNGAKKLNNVEIEMNRTTDEVTWSVASGTSQGIAGNLTLTKGESYLYSLAHDFDVDGNFLVGANGTWGSLGHTGAHEAASLTINSGGSYIATSGTTTITTATGAGSSSNRAAFCHASGTFTHNNGLFKTTAGNADVEFTSQSETNNPFYDFEATQYAIAATSPWVVLNNMTIANGFQFNGSSGYAKVLGIMKQTGGTYNASDVSSSTNHFFNHYKLEGGTLDLSNIDITVGSIRNTGGTIS